MKKYIALFLLGIILSSAEGFCCDCVKDSSISQNSKETSPEVNYFEFKQLVKQIQKKNEEMGIMPPIEPIYIEQQKENPFLDDGLSEEY